MSARRVGQGRRALGAAVAACFLALASPASAQGRYEGTTEAQKLLKQAERLEGEAASLKGSRPDDAEDRYEEALSKCEEALEADPEFLDAYVRLGYLYYALGRNQDGAERLAEAVKRWPDQGRLQRVYGTVLFELPGRRPEAVKLLEAAGKADPEQFDVWFLLGKHYYEAGEWGDGARVLRKYLALEPDDVQGHGTLGNIYLKTEKLEPALAEFRLVLSLEPSNLAAQINIANILFKKGAHEESAKLLEQVLTKDPKQLGARFNLASCRYEQGRYEDAIAQWRAFLEGQPGHGAASYMVGVSLSELGRWDEARAAFVDLARRKPDHAKARWRLALLDLREGKLPEARKHADEALKLAPKDATILWTAGDVRRRQGAPEEALKLHEEGLALGPSAALYASKGRDLYALGRLDEAAESLEQAVAQPQGGAQAREPLGVVLLARAHRSLSLGEPDAAKRDAARLEQLDGVRPVGLALLRAALDLASGDLDGARAKVDEAERAAQGAPCTPADCPKREVAAAKGRLRLRAGDFEGARELLASLLTGEGATQDPTLANDLGRAYAGLGAWDKALEWFVLARDKGMEPSQAERNVALAAIHLSEQWGDKGQWRDALEVLESAEALRERLSPGDQVVLDLAWGTAWAEAGSAPKALGRLKAAEQRLRQLSPQERARLPSPEALELRQAYLLHRLGQDDKALALLERLNLRALPEGGRLMLAVCTGLAERQWGAGKVGAAREFLKKAQPYAPNDPWLQHNLAVLDYAEGKKVGEAFGKMVQQGRIPEALYNQAIYLDDVVGDERGAYDLYRRLQAKPGPVGERARAKADSKARVFGFE
jgi:tetratricopeptide (TPR) repeat protein